LGTKDIWPTEKKLAASTPKVLLKDPD